MALLFVDSFDHYTTILDKWDSVFGSPSITTGRFGSGMVTPDTNHGVIKQLPVGQSWVLGTAFRNTGAGAGTVLRLDSGSTEQIHVEQVSNRFNVYRGTTLLIAGTRTYPANTWTYVELKVTLNTSGGTAELHLDGTIEGSIFTGNTANAGGTTADALRLAWANSGGGSPIWDDLYVCDQSGSTNNDFLGDVRIEALFPSGDGNSSMLVGSDGNSVNNSLLVDEAAPNSDTDYVESATVNDKDTYAFGNLTPTAGTVFGMQLSPYAKKTDAGTRTIASIARLSGTEVDSAATALSTSYRYLRDIRETRPGGGAWTITDVNAAEFGIKVVS